MKIKWDEPKSSFRQRWKEKIFAQIRHTSLLRIGFWLLIVLPLAIYFLTAIYPPKDFHWYYLPVIFFICGLFIVLQTLMLYYTGKSTVSIDEEGISLRGPDARLRKYLYSKMTSIELLRNLHGYYSLSWEYEGKKIIRGVSEEIEISKIKSLVENNSNLELIIRQR